MRNLRKFTHDMLSRAKDAKKSAVGVGGAVLASTQAQAAITAPDFSSNLADVGILLTAMVGFGAFVWGARKLLGFAS